MTLPDWITLRILIAAVEEGSVARAAVRCGIANSAAAKRLQDLEAAYGVALFERAARGVRVTPAGEAFTARARALLDMTARTADEMRAYAAGGVGSVRLHATASAIAGEGLAASLAEFDRARPGITVELREDTSPPILRDILDERADLGIITGGNTVPQGLRAHPWRQDHLLLVAGADHPLASARRLRFAQVLDHPLVGVLEGGALSLLLEEEAGRLGRAPNFRFHVASPDAARRLVAAGHGVTIMPDEVAAPSLAALGLRGVPLAESWARRHLRLVAREGGPASAPAALLLEHLLSRSSRRRGEAHNER